MKNAQTNFLKTQTQVNLTSKQIQGFWRRVDKTSTPIGCWLWIGVRDRKGYGRLVLNYKSYFAHRISFFLNTGKWPEGKMVCHHCDTPPCCNPNHIYEGTAKTNTGDAVARNRMATGARHGSQTHPERIARGERHGSRLHHGYLPKGEEVWNAKFTKKQILHIRKLYRGGKFTQWQIADKFQVGQPTINKIVNLESWKHIK